jgi:hypothetical protein
MTPDRRILLALLTCSILAGCQDMGTTPEFSTVPSSPPLSQDTLTFAANILPIFQRYGCTGCHGGSGGLFVGSVSQLLKGGVHGAAIVPGNGSGSNIIKKLSPNPPFGSRMPEGGPYLPDSTIQVIKTWIDEGAKP